MNILAIDTALGACSAAVSWRRKDGDGGGKGEFEVYEDMGRGHGERITAMIGEVIGHAGLAFADLDRLAVTVGPGTFTGVRIGIAAARGLALATGKPLVGATTLSVMAAQYLGGVAMSARPARLGVVVDARRGQVYAQYYDGLAGPVGAAGVLDIDAAARDVRPGDVLVGSGAPLVAEAAPCDRDAFTVRAPELQPHSLALARLAGRLEATAGPLSPFYLRPPDAKQQTRAIAVSPD